MFSTTIAALRFSATICLLWLIVPAVGSATSNDVVLVVGDSLSAGYGIPLSAAWPELLQQRLAEKGYDDRVENASISGDTSRGGLARLPTLLRTHAPKIVVLELGANDGLRGIAIPDIERNFRKMLDLIDATGAMILLLEMRVPPNYGPGYATQFDQLYARLEQTHELRLVPFFLRNVVLDRSLMQNDGLHPNALAQPKMLDNVWVYLEDIFP
ncbi:MAG: acyl-CoA thioesterase-1 [Gammaproteobacteria bacterium]|jgi:acyl-CoA thioesterase-1